MGNKSIFPWEVWAGRQWLASLGSVSKALYVGQGITFAVVALPFTTWET